MSCQLEQELLDGIDASLRLRIEENAVFLAERLFAEFPSQTSLLKVAECYRAAGDVPTALRLLRHHAPFTQLPPTASSSSSSGLSALSADGAAGANGGMFINSPQWRLNYLLGVLSVRNHQYAEAERVLLPLLGRAVMAQAGADAAAVLAAQKEGQTAEAGVRYWLGVCSCHQGEAARQRPSTLFNQCIAQCPALFCALDEGVRRSDLAVAGVDRDTAARVMQMAAQQQQPQQPQQGAAAASAAASPAQQQQQHAGQNHIYSVLVSAEGANAPAAAAVKRGTVSLARFLAPFADIHTLVSGTYQSGEAIRFFSQQDALAEVTALTRESDGGVAVAAMSPAQRSSGWCLEQHAMALFHGGRTQDAISAFERLRQREPWRLNTAAMVYFSTCLWHGRLEVPLCALAQRMIDCIPRSPFTLCVVGNCHSLNRDARAAATMFSRAATLDPKFAYAHTLRGHELLALEEMQDAEAAFYEAIRWDKRHYAAYAGLGEAYFRLEKEGPARENFQAALKINGTLPAVLCRLAATYHRVGATATDLQTALSLYEASLQRCPSHLPSAQQHAAILVRLGRLHEAQGRLAKLLADCPEEPALHVAYGKCLAKLGNTEEAIREFHKAMDLDPRRGASVRVLLDRVAAKKDVDAVDH